MCCVGEKKVSQSVLTIDTITEIWRDLKGFNFLTALTTHFSGNSMSSMVSGSGTPLVSGSSSTKPPARKARNPTQHNSIMHLSFDSHIYLTFTLRKPTKDDEWQLQPDHSQSVEQEWSHNASNITQSGTNRHSQVPKDIKTAFLLIY